MIELRAGAATATLDEHLGGRLAQLDLGTGPLLRGPAPGRRWSDWGSYPLLPWSNRIPGGRLAPDGGEVEVPVNWPDGSAIHGLVASCPWDVVERTERAATLVVAAATPPWSVVGHQRFELVPEHLVQTLAVENVGPEAVPVGLGIHPWFRAGRLRLPATMKWPGDPLPVGVPVPVDATDDLRTARVPPPMDRCFTGLTASSLELDTVRLSWRGPVSQVVVYTGEPGWMAVEPVTMANDGFALAARGVPGHGVTLLGPGERLEVTYRFSRPERPTTEG